jgi:hypothetical protein
MQPKDRQDPTSWSILSLLDDQDLLKQGGGLLSPRQFAQACSDCGLATKEGELEYYERRSWLSPLIRIPREKQWLKPRGDGGWDIVEVPDGEELDADLRYRFATYTTSGMNLLTLRDADSIIDPRKQPFRAWSQYRDAKAHEESVSTYYVLYQLLHVQWLWEYVELDQRWHHVGPVDDWYPYIRVRKNQLPRQRRALAQQVQDLDHLVLFLLAIQNRYRPDLTHIIANYPNRLNDWYRYRDKFSPTALLAQVAATVDLLRIWRDNLCDHAKKVDPLQEWYDLVGYINWTKREKLTGPARLAQELYVMSDMIDRFLRDWAREEGREEPPFTCLGHPEYEQRLYGGRTINFRDRNILEKILTDYDVNPRPHVLFVVEGDTEFQVIPLIAEAMEYRLADEGIELHNIEGVDKDLRVLANLIAPPRLGAPLEPGLYSAVRQTRMYAHFDREGQWQKDADVAKYIANLKSRLRQLLPDDLPEDAKDYVVERSVTVERWKQSFELDNFSDVELAKAISVYARIKGWPKITPANVAGIRHRFPQKSLDGVIADKVRASMALGSTLIKDKDYAWDKVMVGRYLVRKLVKRMATHQPGDPSEAPIIDVILQVVQMARENWP